ncbi:MAG: PilZ domain-containing protein [Nitrospiraceae bacterium]
MAEKQTHERAHPRRKIYMTCEISHGDRLVSGKIIDASYGGIGVLLPAGAESIKGEARVHISPLRESPVQSPEEIMLRAQPVYLKQMSKGHHVGFKIEEIESGEPEWTRLCDSLTRNA